MSLTFVNQVGAPGGLNQAAPGMFLPETFVRWSQDIFYDRVGELRRRAPYKTLALFNEAGTALAQPSTDGERVIGVVNTRNPNNENRIGIIVTDGTNTRILFYDDEYRKTCFCEIESVKQDTIVFSRPTLDGGVFIGLLEDYGTTAGGTSKNVLYYWRGGTGVGNYAVQNATLGVTNDVEITGNYTHSNNTMTCSTDHNLQAGYKITITDDGSGAPGDPFTVGNVYTVASTGLTSTAFEIEETLTNTDSNNVKFIIATHVTHTDTITGTFDRTSVTPGMFAYRVVGGTYSNNTITGGTDYYLGIVKSVSNTQVILDKDIIRTFGHNTSLHAINTNQQIRFVNIRPYIHNHGRGLITREPHGFTVTSGVVGSEGEGHFAAANLGEQYVDGGYNYGWALYRASDGEWIGDVDTVTDNAALTLSTIAHSDNVPMNADEYVARRYGPIYEGNDADKYTGVFNTTYAGYQWYGNGGVVGTENRIVFSSYHDAESVDLSKDAADSIIIPGTQQMRGIATSASGLLIFLEDKTYLLRGNYRANFSLEELYPEGCLSAQSIVEYGGGVFWAAKNGILFYDGATVRNLTESNLGSYYTDSIKTFDASKRRIYSFFYKDYLFVSFSGFASSYAPSRYEPLYVDTIDDSPTGFTKEQIQVLDPSFTNDDFRVENNVPIYWQKYDMYTPAKGGAQNTSGTWSAGKSFPNADITSTTTLTLDSSFDLNTFSGTADDTTDKISATNHGLVNGTILRFTTGVTGITTGTINYYVINRTANDFEISTTPAGTAVDITAAGSVAGVVLPGDRVIGPGIPANTLVANVTSATSITLSQASTNATNISVQLIPNAPLNTWSKIFTFVWGPVDLIESITFAIYLPSNAITAVSNFDFKGFIKLDSTKTGTRGYAGINAVNPDNLTGTYARLIDVDSMLEYTDTHTSIEDSELSENIGKNPSLYYKGPDFYLQTKNYTVGDPIVKKWFRQVMLNLYLHDGGMRMDLIDLEDNDFVDIIKKRRRNWEIFGEAGYSWNIWERTIVNTLASPGEPLWDVVKVQGESWYQITNAEYERRKKKISWRYPSAGFRLYQMRSYRPRNYQYPQKPHTIKIDSWNLGFKPLRASRA